VLKRSLIFLDRIQAEHHSFKTDPLKNEQKRETNTV